MSSYDGQAVITSEDGAETAVTANLAQYRSGLRTSWGGTLTPAADDLQRMLNLTEGTLRLPNGHEAQFLRPDTSDWLARKQLTVIGQGDAPF